MSIPTHKNNPSSLGNREAGKPGYVTINSCTGRFLGVKSISSIVNMSAKFRGMNVLLSFKSFLEGGASDE